jgi:V/A-type H+-transporting ATPase subunit E
MGEAEAESKQTLADAEKKRDAILADARERALQLSKSEEARGLVEKEKMISRRKSVADIDCRKVILDQKQKLISQCFDEAVNAIVSMDEDRYLGLMIAMGKATGQKGGALIFNQKDQQTIGPRVAAALNESQEKAMFFVSEETRNMKGGYLLQVDKIYINNTIEALVEEQKDRLSFEVAKMLFE